MPAERAEQRRAAGAALAVKRGQAPASGLKGASRSMLKSMTSAELADFASSPRTTKEVIGNHPSASSSHKSGHKSKHKKAKK